MFREHQGCQEYHHDHHDPEVLVQTDKMRNRYPQLLVLVE
jgi:hypothetical protein